MKQSSVMKTLFVALPVGMLLGIAGTVIAADPKLDEAIVHVERAIKTLEAANNKTKRHGAEFGGHRHAAIDHLNKAKREIEKAKEFDDRDDGKHPKDPNPKDPKDPNPKNPKDPNPKDPNPKDPPPKNPKGPGSPK
jgi:hypothetical protein